LGLAHLHANAVVHRDLKPDNLLVANKVSPSSSSGDGGDVDTVFVKITDFGSCKDTLHGGVCQTTVNVVGTVPYMAPEAVRGKFSEASDVWAFAMTFIELATPRQRLWSHLRVTETFALLLRIGALKPPHHQHPIPEWLSPAAHDILRDCLAFDPAARPLCTELLQRPYFIADHSDGDGMEPLVDFEASVG
jgi:serine/threonine protein kinase